MHNKTVFYGKCFLRRFSKWKLRESTPLTPQVGVRNILF